MKITLSFFVLMFSLSGFADTTPAPQTDYQKLVQFSVKNGTRMDIDEGTFMVLKDQTGDPTKSFHVDYFSSVGVDLQNGFAVDHTEVVSEDWVLADGEWQVDQWSFFGDLEGNIMLANHQFLIETAAHELLSETDLHPTPAAQYKTWKTTIQTLETQFLQTH